MLKEMKLSRIKEEMPNVSLRLVRHKSTEYDIEILNCSNVEVYDLIFKDCPELRIWNCRTNDIGFFKNCL